VEDVRYSMIERYTTKELGRIWSDENKYRQWLLVETAVARVQEKLGIIPKGLARKLPSVKIRPRDVDRMEEKVKHDVIAFLELVRGQLGREGKYLHFGMTSYDLVDTALTLMLKESGLVILGSLTELRRITRKIAVRHKFTPMMGRTHGMHAQPITFGFKVLSWYEEILRNVERLETAIEVMSYGKISGAVGIYANISPRVEGMVLRNLGLKTEPVSTQVIPRDRHAQFLSALALIASCYERIATEIRNLQRSEIGEVAEPFAKGQKGSSAMPHKKNPINCERLTGLARVVRGYLTPSLESIALWHERDISNSSLERITLPDATILVHYMTRILIEILDNLEVYPKKMRENLKKSRGVYFSQTLLMKLVEKGIEAKKAYEMVQAMSFKAIETDRELESIAASVLTPKERREVFDLKRLFKEVPAIFKRVL
jgi:adenylosuccinate lyase